VSVRTRVTVCGLAVAAVVAGVSAPTAAAAPPIAGTHILVHFDLASAQQPENVSAEPDGSVDLTFSRARQVARVNPAGVVRILATLPDPGTDVTPVLGAPFVTGIVRAHDGTLYVGYATGTADLTGIWRVTPAGSASRIVPLPADGLPNGLALDERAGQLYVADSVLGTVWRAPLCGGAPVAWASDPALRPAGFLGANGIKVHAGAVWVSNTDQGTVLRIPVRRDGSPGAVASAVTGLTGPDDFAFAGRADDLLVALDAANEVAYVATGRPPAIVLTAQDGLSNPTSVAVRGTTVYVPSAAYLTQQDPNLLTARLDIPRNS
jgi:hypothetical protein